MVSEASIRGLRAKRMWSKLALRGCPGERIFGTYYKAGLRRASVLAASLPTAPGIKGAIFEPMLVTRLSCERKGCSSLMLGIVEMLERKDLSGRSSMSARIMACSLSVYFILAKSLTPAETRNL